MSLLSISNRPVIVQHKQRFSMRRDSILWELISPTAKLLREEENRRKCEAMADDYRRLYYLQLDMRSKASSA